MQWDCTEVEAEDRFPSGFLEENGFGAVQVLHSAAVKPLFYCSSFSSSFPPFFISFFNLYFIFISFYFHYFLPLFLSGSEEPVFHAVPLHFPAPRLLKGKAASPPSSIEREK